MLQQLVTSKKFLVAFSSILFVLTNEIFSFGIQETTILEVVSVSAAYIVGQGVADSGKEKSRFEASVTSK